MKNIKKVVFASLIGLGGLFLSFAGLNLISLSQQLILYTGILYLILAVLLYLFL